MHTLIHRFADCRLLVIGDLMIDEYVWGTSIASRRRPPFKWFPSSGKT